MSKVAEQKALEEYPIAIIPDDDTMGFTSSDRNEIIRFGYINGYDQALCDIKQRIIEIINNQKKEWLLTDADIGLYTILGHIVEMEEAQ